MIYQLKDLQDWDLIKNDSLRPVTQTFELQEAVMEIYDMMLIKSKPRQIYLKFEQEYFDDPKIISSLPSKVIGDKSRL
jgi:hypothetical protein